jgi:CrcB protein
MGWQNSLAVMLGSALGALCRYALATYTNAMVRNFYLGTFLANVLGCLLMGVALARLHASAWSSAARLFVTTGFLGGFTTFSTFSAETVSLCKAGCWRDALIYGLASLLVSLLATVSGWWLFRLPANS